MSASSQDSLVFGGIEGGGTHSKLVLMKSDGSIIAETAGDCTNHWLVGLDVCLQRIHDMVAEAKKKAGLHTSTPLKSLGMSLSGGDQTDSQLKIINGLNAKYNGLSENYFVCNDTQGALATATEKGGVVLIAGTGSNCILIDEAGQTFGCGGWGHLMGDEGGAYVITQTALKILFDHEDNLFPSPSDVSFVKQTMCNHFKITNRMELLDYLYAKFDKSFIASMCKELARGASELKDPLCCHVFKEAGTVLARHVLAVAGKVDKSFYTAPNSLDVVCVGSVWKSWDLLKEGFITGLQSRPDVHLETVNLLHLNKSGAVGAASLGAKKANCHLEMDYHANASVFYSHNFSET